MADQLAPFYQDFIKIHGKKININLLMIQNPKKDATQMVLMNTCCMMLSTKQATKHLIIYESYIHAYLFFITSDSRISLLYYIRGTIFVLLKIRAVRRSTTNALPLIRYYIAT